MILAALFCLSLSLSADPQAVEPPEIVEFKITPDKFSVNMTATISWWIKNFRWAKIDGAGPVPTEIKDPAGSIKVSGKDLAGNASRSLQLTVQGNDKSYLYKNVSFELCGMPLIKNFRASPRPSVYEPVRIKKGDRVTFSYFFANVARAEIWAGGRKLADAHLPSEELYGTSTEFIPEATGSTQLYAYNCAGDVIKSEAVAVEVFSAAPEITGFFCDIAGLVIRRSQPVTFRWTIREAAEASLDNSRVNPSIGSQTIQGLAVPKEFVLTARNPAGTATQKIFIDVMPEILFFTSSLPGPIVPGDSVELRWSVSPKARALSLMETVAEPPAVEPRPIAVENAETGSVLVSPERTAIYRLTIEGPIPGELYKEVTVLVLTKPEVVSFFSNPAADPSQRLYKLFWQTINADSVEIRPGIGQTGAQGQTQVGPLPGPTEYTLIARNKAGSVEKRLLVEVLPEILSFAVDKPVVAVQDRVTLTWRTSGASDLTLRWAGGEKKVEAGSRNEGAFTSPSLESTNVFELEARSAGGAAKKSLTVTVERKPVIDRFETSAANNLVLKNASFKLRWAISDAASAEINGEKIDPSIGEKTVQVSQTTTFTLEARSQAGADRRSLTIKVIPEITLFQADPLRVKANEKTHLTWKTEPEAETAKIIDPAGAVLAEASNSQSGTCEVSPDKTTTFELIVQPGDVSQKVSVEVVPGEPEDKKEEIVVPTRIRVPQTVARRLKAPVGTAVESFAASPESVSRGEEVTLSWSLWTAKSATLVINGKEVPIRVPRGEYKFTPQCTPPSGQGTCAVKCTIKGLRNTGVKFEKELIIRVNI